MAPKPPQATTVAMASPPRMCPRNALEALKRSSDRPARATNIPIMTNSGTTERP